MERLTDEDWRKALEYLKAEDRAAVEAQRKRR